MPFPRSQTTPVALSSTLFHFQCTCRSEPGAIFQRCLPAAVCSYKTLSLSQLAVPRVRLQARRGAPRHSVRAGSGCCDRSSPLSGHSPRRSREHPVPTSPLVSITCKTPRMNQTIIHLDRPGVVCSACVFRRAGRGRLCTCAEPDPADGRRSWRGPCTAVLAAVGRALRHTRPGLPASALLLTAPAASSLPTPLLPTATEKTAEVTDLLPLPYFHT